LWTSSVLGAHRHSEVDDPTITQRSVRENQGSPRRCGDLSEADGADPASIDAVRGEIEAAHTQAASRMQKKPRPPQAAVLVVAVQSAGGTTTPTK